MPFYIVPFNYDSNLSVLKLNQSGLSVLFYKSKEGPLGLCVDDFSTEIFYSLIKDGLWYSISEKRLMQLDRITFDSNKFNLKGLIFLLPKKNSNEIELCKEALSIMKKNILLLKYNKPILRIPNSTIVNSHINDVYNKEETAFLLNESDALLWNWSEFGGHLIFNQFRNKYFIDILKIKCEEANESIIYCDSLELIPSW